MPRVSGCWCRCVHNFATRRDVTTDFAVDTVKMMADNGAVLGSFRLLTPGPLLVWRGEGEFYFVGR